MRPAAICRGSRRRPRPPSLGAGRAADDFAKSGNITPVNYFGDGKFYAVNTMQPPYQPSRNKPAAGDAELRCSRTPNNPTTLPPQIQRNHRRCAGRQGMSIGHGTRAPGTPRSRTARRPPSKMREVIYAPETAGGNPDFQPHHQPFNYYERFDPATHAEQRAAHLKDYDDLIDGYRRRPLARGDVLQAAGQSQPACRLRLGRRGRCAHRGLGGETARRPAVAAHGDRDHLR